MNDGGWTRPDVARAQRALATKQLLNPEGSGPFAAFLRAMDVVPHTGSFLDIGCGVGHYGALLRERYPHLRYVGMDYSPAMIAEAREVNPGGNYQVVAFGDVDFTVFDIVLAGQVLEYQPEPFAALVRLVERPGWTILHRLRLTRDTSHRTELESTYCGHRAPNWMWNRHAVEAVVQARGAQIVYADEWEHNLTLVVRK